MMKMKINEKTTRIRTTKVKTRIRFMNESFLRTLTSTVKFLITPWILFVYQLFVHGVMFAAIIGLQLAVFWMLEIVFPHTEGSPSILILLKNTIIVLTSIMFLASTILILIKSALELA